MRANFAKIIKHRISTASFVYLISIKENSLASLHDVELLRQIFEGT